MKGKLSIISRISLACFAAYFSVVVCLGLVAGYFLGRYVSRKIFYGKFKSLTFELKGIKIHLHHWVFGVVWLVCLRFFAQGFFENLFIVSIGGGVVFEDIWHDKKWFKVFGRVRR